MSVHIMCVFINYINRNDNIIFSKERYNEKIYNEKIIFKTIDSY